jgi:hypothetical protein
MTWRQRGDARSRHTEIARRLVMSGDVSAARERYWTLVQPLLDH